MTSLEITRLKQQLVCCNNEKAKLQREMDALRTRNETLTSDLYECNNTVVGVIVYARSSVGHQVMSLKDSSGDDVEVLSNAAYLVDFPILSVTDAILFKINVASTSVTVHINVPTSPGSSQIDVAAYSGVIDRDNFGFGAGGGEGDVTLDVDLSTGCLFITTEG